MSIRYSIAEAEKKGFISKEVATKLKAKARKKSKKEESPIEEKLNSALSEEFPGKFERELKFHPARRFRLDFAFTSLKIAIEVDGYRSHGLSLSGFKRDRVKRNLLAVDGWIVLSFYADQIFNEMDGVIEIIREAVGKSTAKAHEKNEILAYY